MTDQKKPDYRSRAERMKDKEAEQSDALNQEENSRPAGKPRVYQEKPESKRKYLYILAAVVILIMFLMIVRAVFIPRDQVREDTSEKISLALEETSQKSSEEPSEESSEEESSEERSSEVETSESVESSEESVTVTDLESEEEAEEVVTGDWDPVPTEQTGEHVTDYSSGSQDRIEIKQAAAIATGIDPDNMSEHWVGNDGSNQGVYATVSDGYQGRQYRVHIQWVDGQGWQPVSVEALE